jgi:hypothetical protein
MKSHCPVAIAHVGDAKLAGFTNTTRDPGPNRHQVAHCEPQNIFSYLNNPTGEFVTGDDWAQMAAVGMASGNRKEQRVMRVFPGVGAAHTGGCHAQQ